MTEKCFKAIGKEIWKGNRIWCVCGGEHCADVIATAMNEFIKENEQLNQEVQEYIKALNKTLEEKEELWKENEQLQNELADAKELNRIYVDFLVDKGFELSDVIEWSKKELIG